MAYQIKYRSEEEMKDSGVEWLGEIPSEWLKTDLIKALDTKIADGPHETPEYVDEGIPFISVDSVNDSETVNLDIVRKFISYKQYKEYNKKTRLQKNDILFTKSATIGKVAIVDDRTFMTWSPLAIIKANNEVINYKLLYNILKSSRYIDYIKSISSLNTQLNVGMGVLEKSMITYSRDLEEQQKIANFLDLNTSEFDIIISKKELLIEKLEEAKKSLISEVVTGKVKIVDGKLFERQEDEMKDSGVDWLGMIPRDWEIKRMKYICSVTTGNKDTVDNIEDGIYPFFVRSDTIEKINSYSFDGEAILTAGDGVGVAKVFHYVKGKFDFHQRVYMLYDFKNIEPKLLFFYIKENFHKEVLKISAKSTVDSLRLPMFLNFNVCLGSKFEQKNIVQLLNYKTSKMDNVIKKQNIILQKVKQAKQSLISEAVTGKIDLRDWEIQ